jgi:hypothetical protein
MDEALLRATSFSLLLFDTIHRSRDRVQPAHNMVLLHGFIKKTKKTSPGGFSTGQENDANEVFEKRYPQ